MRFSFSVGVVLASFLSHESYNPKAFTPSKHRYHVSRPALYASAATEVPPIVSRSSDGDNDDKNSRKKGDDSVEFPPPLSRVDRLTRAATFWSKAIPIVANYYGLIGNIKLQEIMGETLGNDDIEVSLIQKDLLYLFCGK